ncbi:DUF1292 domain-containing protein [Haloimpatiens sp. FM7315]|uniref:DUF1292 domain-containing protein n=1 Tax=Haloimpatiens sp. FM7315 TaxID=3298609 RepID=UPI0035A38F98
MNKEELNKCGCEENHDHECGCESHDHECGCGCDCGCGEHEPMIVELEDENGKIVKCEVVDGFAYKENEYAIVQNPEDDSVYLFKVVGEDETAELVIPDDDEFDEVKDYYESLLED